MVFEIIINAFKQKFVRTWRVIRIFYITMPEEKKFLRFHNIGHRRTSRFESLIAAAVIGTFIRF